MSTVSVTWFDSEAVWQAVEAHARALGARHPEIEEIRVFGSLVRGTAVPGSDVDLLVILERSDQRFLDRIPAFLPRPFGAAWTCSPTPGPSWSGCEARETR